jgi:L-alanine-DL-glutamate epimerase-like enolase superfamily enzyme
VGVSDGPPAGATPTSVALWSVDLPMPAPVHTVIGTLDTMLVAAVLVTDGLGHVGGGYASFPSAEARDETLAVLPALTEAVLAAEPGPSDADLPGAATAAERPSPGDLRRAEQLEADGAVGASTVATRAAACALAAAGWDLAGRRLGVPCAELWGRSDAARPADRPATVDSYASGMFLGTTHDELRAEAEAARAAGFRAVKVRVGADPADDASRVAVVRSVFPAPGTLAADAYESWSADDANAFLEALDAPLRWLEDPTPPSELPDLRPGDTPLASGERCGSAGEAEALVDLLAIAGQELHVLLDVQALGGPARFLAAAAGLQARGVGVGSHVYPHWSGHLLAACGSEQPLEVLDWWDRLYTASPQPGPDGRVAVEGPGFGWSIDEEALARHGRPAWHWERQR